MKKSTGILLGAAAAGAAFVVARELRQASNEVSLAGEVVLITGGSRGLGLALAREFARNGCRIAICARDRAQLDAAVRELRASNAEAFGFACDVGSKEEVERLLAAVREHYGRIDILVNNAGVIQVAPVDSLQEADFEKAMHAIFWGTVHPTLGVLPEFLERGSGRVVNISSIGGKLGIPHLMPYASAKFAVAGFSQALAAEVKSRGVSVTAIYPGLLRTGSFVEAEFKGDQAKEAEWFTLGATLPGVSMNTDRAAKQIVTAIKRETTDQTLSLPAKAAEMANHLFPGGVTELLGWVTSAVLPKPRRSSGTKKGGALWAKMNPAVRILAQLGLKAMKNYNQRAKLSGT